MFYVRPFVRRCLVPFLGVDINSPTLCLKLKRLRLNEQKVEEGDRGGEVTVRRGRRGREGSALL